MFLRINKALNDRRAGIKSEEGFTLIELLVVVIIIGILAAIAIPVYLGIQNNAKDSAVKSDVSRLKTAIVAYQTDNGELPATVAVLAEDGNEKYGYTALADDPNYAEAADMPNYSAAGPSADSFCVEATSVTESVFHATSDAGVAEDGCP